MALYALDEENQIVFAQEAAPYRRYRCLECSGRVQKRSGIYKRAHFCHLRSAPQCRLHSKSIDHLILQTDLKKKIPQLEMERPFPSILRIADLCWEEKKLVLEIQCSPITPSEVERRKRDYAREGYDLVWLLDERLFNKKRLRIAEENLRRQSAYYFSLSRACVYDQFEVIAENLRLMRGPPLSIDLTRPHPTQGRNLPLRQLQERQSPWYFPGDLYDRSIRNRYYLQRLAEKEKELLAPFKRDPLFWLKKGFYIALEYLLRATAED